jgi:hypothetical protein
MRFNLPAWFLSAKNRPDLLMLTQAFSQVVSHSTLLKRACRASRLSRLFDWSHDGQDFDSRIGSDSAPKERDGNSSAESPTRLAGTCEELWFYDRRHPDASARYRRKHRDLFRRQRRPFAAALVTDPDRVLELELSSPQGNGDIASISEVQ